ncbi:MAG: autotransporter domain-containing protein [Pseudomonadota bacterium]
MQKLKLLLNVGVIGLAGGLAMPAFASEGDAAEDEVVLEARGTFDGFRIEPRLSTIMAPDLSMASTFATPRNFEATPTPAQPEIIARDDVGVGGIVDVQNTQPSVVQLFFQDNTTGGIFFNCTGTVINPRTVLTAAHCLNSSPSESYGTIETGDNSILISSGVDSSVRFFEYLDTGANYAEGGVATSTDVVIHASSNLENGGLAFPWADIALVAVDSPITDIPSMPILLTPLDELTHVVQVGYGTFGVANGVDGGGTAGIGFLRRVGENMLGAIASPSDLGDSLFPAFAPTANFGFETQAYYFTDFDNPDRTQAEIDGCVFEPTGVTCDSLEAIRAIDYFDDDALPNEVATAGGDSGSPLIVDELYDFPIVAAVLSGGFDFFGVPEGYGDISFYNPIYPFFEFISENTAYKYVSAEAGNGVWSDASRWTQDLDPGFFIDDGTGTLVNGLPTGSEPGVYEAGPKLGTIVGIDISGNSTAPSPFLPPEGTPNFGANTPDSSVLLGPGSTGFVPNNTDGTVGTAFENPAQYFEVHLNNFGRTTVDMDVEIDKLVIDNGDASFILPTAYDFSSIIGVEQYNGIAKLDGTLDAGIYALFGGITQGNGTINTNAFFNIEGAVAPGTLRKTGTLTINGDYVQSSAGSLLVDISYSRSRIKSDLLVVNGDASLAGTLAIRGLGRPRFGDEAVVVSANSVLGDFQEVNLFTRSPILFAETRVDGGDVIVTVNARSIGDMVNGNLQGVGDSLDRIRFEGRGDGFVGLFDVIDNAGLATLLPTLTSLTPVSAFGQTMVANSFSQRFTGQLGQRTLALRGANKAAAGFSSGGNASFAIAGTSPGEGSKLGFFSTVSGVFLNAEERNDGASALEEAAFTQSGELTLGADMEITDDFSVGFAMTSIRNSGTSVGAIQRPDDTSVAGAGFAAYQFGNGFADMYVGFARQTLGAERASQGEFASLFSSANGAARGNQTFSGMRVGYALDVAEGVEVGPVASVDYVRNDIGGYTEFGAAQFGLNVHDRTFTSVGTKLGLMGSVDTGIGRKGTLSAFGSVAYARELADTADIVTANFIGAADVPFAISNALDPEWVSVNAGAEMSLGGNLSVSLSGTSDLGRGVLTNNQGRMTLNWRF